MANTASAKRNVKKNENRRLINASRRSAIKTSIKKTLIAIEEKNGQMDILLADVAAKLARAKSKGTIHANTAARKLSRLAKKVAATKKPAA